MPSGAATAKPFTYEGKIYPSLMAFCRERGLDYDTVRSRIARGITGERLVARRLPRTKRF